MSSFRNFVSTSSEQIDVVGKYFEFCFLFCYSLTGRQGFVVAIKFNRRLYEPCAAASAAAAATTATVTTTAAAAQRPS